VKLRFDQNLSFRLCRLVSDLFPESMQVASLGLAKADDRRIWEYARSHDFAIVSLDADFAEMASVLGPPPKVIWLRIGNQPTDSTARIIRTEAETIALFLHDTESACLEVYGPG
jgi:predicted nuclease of predicted toxin-antitoxin system